MAELTASEFDDAMDHFCAGLTAGTRLIAAAPDLHKVVSDLLLIDFERFTEHDELLLDDVLEQARAALAKANPTQEA